MQTFYAASTNGFYVDDIHGDAMPQDVVEITTAAHAALLDAQAAGQTIVAGADGLPALIAPPQPSAAEVLAAAKGAALAGAALMIAAARTGFITDLPGQEMIYLGKEDEARRWLAASAPVLVDYPFLAAEVGITAATPGELAALWLAMAAAWRSVAAQIEAARMTAVGAIGAAGTAGEAEAAVGALQAALGQIAGGV